MTSADQISQKWICVPEKDSWKGLLLISIYFLLRFRYAGRRIWKWSCWLWTVVEIFAQFQLARRFKVLALSSLAPLGTWFYWLPLRALLFQNSNLNRSAFYCTDGVIAGIRLSIRNKCCFRCIFLFGSILSRAGLKICLVRNWIIAIFGTFIYHRKEFAIRYFDVINLNPIGRAITGTEGVEGEERGL